MTRLRLGRSHGAEFCPKEAFDVVARPTEYQPFTRMGYLTFHVMKFHHGWISYSEGFQARSLRIWPRTPRRGFYDSNPEW